ncbi:hypothetical protein Pelo_8325 [Pelomyxa schiedti]|nr:hypothetical protein Pelo_8325 [Pelomyxa schiedti]
MTNPPPISVVVRIVQSQLPEDHTTCFMEAVHNELSTEYPGYRGFLSVVFKCVPRWPGTLSAPISTSPLIKSSGSPPTDTESPPKAATATWTIVASFLTVQDAVAALPFYNDFVTNKRANPLGINLEAEGILQALQVITNF